MASETMRRLDEIVGAFREGAIVRVSCGGMLCGECIQCTARAAKASLQRERRAAQDEIDRLTRELEAARELLRQIAADRCRCLHPFDICGNCRARRALAKDTEGGYADPPAHPARMAQPDEEIAL